jgi:tetraacyldisaccharide 4'-kinase
MLAMSDRLKSFGLGALSGTDTSWPARLTRLATAAVEPGYATVMRARNLLYDAGWKRSHDLGRPSISVGNLTTGGTGKTPMVDWLANRLADAGRHPAVLLRGYGSSDGEGSDELAVLRRSLGDRVPVQANPSRVAGGTAVLERSPEVDAFVLDDAFQHRRAKRAFDLVLISATNPFGYEHVLPRGLMREPPAGLRRASAVVVTRCDAVAPDRLETIVQRIRRHHSAVPIYRADHVHSAVWFPATDTTRPIETLSADPFFAVAGIGDPDALDQQLARHGSTYRGHRWFADHHAYASADVEQIHAAAGSARILTTEKDWVKLATVVAPADDRWAVLKLAVRFAGDDERRLLKQILAAI